MKLLLLGLLILPTSASAQWMRLGRATDRPIEAMDTTSFRASGATASVVIRTHYAPKDSAYAGAAKYYTTQTIVNCVTGQLAFGTTAQYDAHDRLLTRTEVQPADWHFLTMPKNSQGEWVGQVICALARTRGLLD
jgi:hypothetical protein